MINNKKRLFIRAALNFCKKKIDSIYLKKKRFQNLSLAGVRRPGAQIQTFVVKTCVLKVFQIIVVWRKISKYGFETKDQLSAT